MKKTFEQPIIEINDMKREDIITTSVFSKNPAGYTPIDFGDLRR